MRESKPTSVGAIIEDIDNVIATVNAFVGQNLWMDFSAWSYAETDLTISGSIDESYGSDLRITFHRVCWASIRFQGWGSDAQRPVLFRIEGEEAKAIHLLHETEQGHHLFKFLPSDFHEPMWIAAQAIDADFTYIDLRSPKFEALRTKN